MIQSNQLRTGDIILEGKIQSFYEHGVHVGFGKCFTFYQINPIPLTEEILLKAGFRKTARPNHIAIKMRSVMMVLLYPKTMGPWQESFCWVYDEYQFTELKYVHQLQNLFNCLSEQELEINI
jgi:hypothetical protein